MSPTNDPAEKQTIQYGAIGSQALTIGAEVGCLTLIIVLGAVFGGLWLDRIFGTKPLLTLFFVIGSAPLSLALTFWIAKRAVNAVEHQTQRLGNRNLRKETKLVSEPQKKRRFGFFRWIVLGLILLGIYAAYMGPSILKPVSPAVILSPEPVWPGFKLLGVYFTNTMLATLIADAILIWLALKASRFLKKGNLVPSGVYNAFEAIFEFLWSSVEGATGKWAKRVVPLVATIFMLIFIANMIKMVPGFESIGYLEQPPKGAAFAPVALFKLGGATVYTIDKAQPVEYEAAESHGEGAAAEEHHELCKACQVIPFLRGSATDLNFTIALAIIAVFMTQIYGAMALGPGYFTKFFQIGKLVNGGLFGLIDFAVGFLELILEFAKILSFSFRLFGNIFAGALLLSIVGALLPVVIPPGLYLFEVFFGIIQAYVFFLLATMFISMAVVSHGGGEHGELHA